jgi:hypothetical protein
VPPKTGAQLSDFACRLNSRRSPHTRENPNPGYHRPSGGGRAGVFCDDSCLAACKLRRLRDLGVIKRVAGTYRYYLTCIGRAATAALCRVTQTVIIPSLA